MSSNNGGIVLFAPSSGEKRTIPPSSSSSPSKKKKKHTLQGGNIALGQASAFEEAAPPTFTILATWLQTALAQLNIHKPTDVQQATIPHALKGESVHAAAPTGSGKTAAYALPLLHRWSQERYGVFALILLPSRELVLQVAETFESLGAPARVAVCRVSGGLDMDTERRALAMRPHFVTATPGRLADHIRSDADAAAALARCRAVVYDEADRLLEPSFEADMATILDALPRGKRQSFLFSATITTDVARAARAMSGAHVYVDAKVRSHKEDDGARVPSHIQQTYLWLPSRVRDAYVFSTLHACLGDRLWREGMGLDRIQGGAKASAAALEAKGGKKRRRESNKPEGGEAASAPAVPASPPSGMRSAIVFCSTREQCQLLHATALALGAKAGALHAGMKQRDREEALLRFRGANLAVLFATDVASRGLDIPTVDLVVNASLPRDPAVYVHRVGRAARERGMRGWAVSCVCERDVSLVQAIETFVYGPTAKRRWELCPWVNDDIVLRQMAKVCTARKVAALRLAEEEELEADRKGKQAAAV